MGEETFSKTDVGMCVDRDMDLEAVVNMPRAKESYRDASRSQYVRGGSMRWSSRRRRMCILRCRRTRK